MFEKVLLEQNPHWEDKPPSLGTPRSLLKKTSQFLDAKQIIIITGIRRCGKSQLLKQLLAHLITQKKNPKNIFCLNLENPYLEPHRRNLSMLEKIYEEYLTLAEPKGKVYLLLDEIQFFANWQVFVKSKYELGNIKFIITGSNSWMLSSEFTTLLSGRSFNFELYPFSFPEFLHAKNIDISTSLKIISQSLKIKKLFHEYSAWGGYPEVCSTTDLEQKKELLTSYYKNILFQDIIPRFKIINFRETEELAHYLLTNIGKTASYNRLSTLLNLSDKTIKEYINYFSQAYLLFEINKYDRSVRKQLSNPKKIYAGDLGISMVQGFRFSPDLGHLLENLVFLELKRQGHTLFYHQNKHECDFLIQKNHRITTAIQVCHQLTPENRQRELLGVIEALKEHNLKQGYILTSDQEEELTSLGYKIKIIPIWKWTIQQTPLHPS